MIAGSMRYSWSGACMQLSAMCLRLFIGLHSSFPLRAGIAASIHVCLLLFIQQCSWGVQYALMSSCSETVLTCAHILRSHGVAGMHIGWACLTLAVMVVQVWELARTPPLVPRQQLPRQEAHGAPMQSEFASSHVRHAAACSHTEAHIQRFFLPADAVLNSLRGTGHGPGPVVGY